MESTMNSGVRGRRMAKQKRKDSQVTKKKNKKLKKAVAREMPLAPAAPPGTEGAPAEGAASPEEQRVLERKLKKERKKEARRRLQEAGISVAQSPAARRSGAALALDYLCSWAQQHENWRFQKTRQTWLLLHMYDRDQRPHSQLWSPGLGGGDGLQRDWRFSA
ncbi:protein cholesin isoform X5 [Tursiops truncatus]|uniref:protein cholesin isoform X5 n=1 Tax=Tursiops truncatus TaxID=9739 RepID=UPI003CCF7121